MLFIQSGTLLERYLEMRQREIHRMILMIRFTLHILLEQQALQLVLVCVSAILRETKPIL